MPVDVEITIDSRRAERMVITFGRAIASPALLYAVAEALRDWLVENVIEEGLEFPWAPLSQNTLVARALTGGGTKPLVASGALLRSLVVSADPGGNSVIAQFLDSKAAWMQEGTQPHDIPASRGKMLLIPTVNGTIFRREIRHPGTLQRALLPSRLMATLLATQVVERHREQAIAQAREAGR
jgi:hypothetical protein